MRRNRSAKIVATLGPASSTKARIRELADAGADVFRFNFSHGSHEDHAARFSLVREVEQERGRPIGTIMDLQGPKLRVGRFADGLLGQTRIVTKSGNSSSVPTRSPRLSCDRPRSFAGSRGRRKLRNSFHHIGTCVRVACHRRTAARHSAGQTTVRSSLARCFTPCPRRSRMRARCASGTENTAGSTVERATADGSVVTYTWDAGRSAYVAERDDDSVAAIDIASRSVRARKSAHVRSSGSADSRRPAKWYPPRGNWSLSRAWVSCTPCLPRCP